MKVRLYITPKNSNILIYCGKAQQSIRLIYLNILSLLSLLSANTR